MMPIRNGTSKTGRILLGSRVLARLGELFPLTLERLTAINPNAKRKPRRINAHIFGNVVSIVGKRKFIVHFDNEIEKEMSSNHLKSHDQAESLPIEDAVAIAASNVIVGDIPASLDELQNLATTAADAAMDALDEDEHLPKEAEIMEDLSIGETQSQGGRVDMVNSEDEADEEASEFVGWGNERQDFSDEKGVMPSLAAGMLTT
jgi:hypothetical protein